MSEESKEQDESDADIEELLEQLRLHKTELVKKIEQLEQALEQENKSRFREILDSVGVWASTNLSWEGMKNAFWYFLSII
jgi:hypothetical protein